MKIRKILNILASMGMSALLSGAIFIVLDCFAVFFQLRMVPAVFFGLLGVLFVGVHFCKIFTMKRKGKMLLILLSVACVVCAASWAVWTSFQKDAAYVDADGGKAGLYSGRDVMVIVPHQDDEANILGGVLEEFRDYGSNVRVVFSTNGDSEGIPFVRMQEAIAYCAYAGIPEENVIFLGYGDRWDNDLGYHLYNAPSSETVTLSKYGTTQTYGMEGHPAYREGNAYTAENFLNDLQSVILEYSPELIFCIDYDDHIEHKALSLAFEKVMGNILKENPQYRPVVLKGYAYGTAWFGEEDFYTTNILSTNNLFQEPYLQQPVSYHWENRIRFPVDGAALSRSLLNSDAFRSLELYTSQNAQYRAQSMVNGDRVFWQRRTDSLCLNAIVEVSSGYGVLLNDFMRLDNFDLWEKVNPEDGIWIPEPGDHEKVVTVTFPEKTDISTIVLCDNPSREHNILNARIVFADGHSVETGPLHIGGAATEIAVNAESVESFRIVLEKTEGELAGLGEIEAYEKPSQGDLRVVKLMDTQGNFVYDYAIGKGSIAGFSVYTCGDVPENYSVSCDNPAIRAELENGKIVVDCPEGEQGTIHLTSDGTDLGDSIYVRNPGAIWELQTKLGQRIEKFAVFQFRDTILFRVGRRILGMLN